MYIEVTEGSSNSWFEDPGFDHVGYLPWPISSSGRIIKLNCEFNSSFLFPFPMRKKKKKQSLPWDCLQRKHKGSYFKFKKWMIDHIQLPTDGDEYEPRRVDAGGRGSVMGGEGGLEGWSVTGGVPCSLLLPPGRKEPSEDVCLVLSCTLDCLESLLEHRSAPNACWVTTCAEGCLMKRFA